MNTAQDPIIVDRRSKVGMIEEDNMRRDAQQLETMKIVAEHEKIWVEHGKIMAEQVRALASHKRRFNVQDQILSE